MKKINILFYFSLLLSCLYCQAPDTNTLPEDSLFIDQVAIKEKNPTTASLLSFAIPGGGQFYNESYIKMGIVLLADTYFVSTANYHEEKRQKNKKKMNNATFEQESQYYKSQMNYHFEKRQSSYWWIGISTFLSITDAYVDAHLYNFDVKKNEIELRFSASNLTLSYKF
ncbi:MAG TPA: DUF5683 domain-containing protein [Candidatus Cloacimonadota bacterium]|nr:DUF5683 domain-containing protein [Candidatus Cloacimonadales bacterium]HPY96872.1 DUF5683 domain-containing protein [Candidatus Cloacimonadota bacterium]HQB40227.1 DUF5683 domain-containing protein [Candidatus Cloacimonadota bacterium]